MGLAFAIFGTKKHKVLLETTSPESTGMVGH